MFDDNLGLDEKPDAVTRGEIVNSASHCSPPALERIYSRRGNTPNSGMVGIFIYTAIPDSEGSLGGLVELGKTDHFHNLPWKALDEARLCTSDALCAEHKPETVGDLNGAACHSCMLVAAETCERSNQFLDACCSLKQGSHQNSPPYFRNR